MSLKIRRTRVVSGKDLYRSITRNLLATSTPEVERPAHVKRPWMTSSFRVYDGALWQPTCGTTSSSS